jgi:ribose transport system substrate-binding protein
MNRRIGLLAGLVLAAAMVVGHRGTALADDAKKDLRIGMVAKSESNDVFQAAKVGAMDAAKELGEKYGIKITIDWRTPADEDAAKQAEAISALTNEHVDGITVSCSDAQTLTGAINDAVDAGVPVVCFDSDAPDSKRPST